MAENTHDCDGLALYLRQLVRAIQMDGSLTKSNQYRTGDLRDLPLFKAAETALDEAHGSFQYRELLERVAVAAAYVVLGTPRAPLPDIARELLRNLDAALDAAEPEWRDSPRFWDMAHRKAVEAP